MFFFWWACTSLLGWVSHFSEQGVVIGRAAQLCKVCPPIMLAAMPDIAVFASKLEAPILLNVFEIAFNSADFPVPPCPQMISSLWGGFLCERWSCKWFIMIVYAIIWCSLRTRFVSLIGGVCHVIAITISSLLRSIITGKSPRENMSCASDDDVISAVSSGLLCRTDSHVWNCRRSLSFASGVAWGYAALYSSSCKTPVSILMVIATSANKCSWGE